MNLQEIIRIAKYKKAVDLKHYDRLMKIARTRLNEARAKILKEQADYNAKQHEKRRCIDSSIY